MTSEQIKQTFEHINNKWNKEQYESSYANWIEIQHFIVYEPDLTTDTKCNNCDTYWSDKKYISVQNNICHACDTYDVPFLCNPINYQYVVFYINSKWYEYILPSGLHYCKICHTCNIPSINSCDYCDISYCDRCLDLQYEISFHKCEECNTQWCYYNGTHVDYKCPKIGIHTVHCDECGL